VDSDHLAETLGRHDEKLDAILERVERVEMKVDYTNGRVRGLELFKARVMALGAVVLLLAPVYLPRIIG
jgi:hypothetical protein